MSPDERAAALQLALPKNVQCDLLSTNSVFANDLAFEQTITAATEYTPRPEQTGRPSLNLHRLHGPTFTL
ncbi:MAG TPA: hypothetical protein VFB59_00905 [Candidatus Saccharimonadales bacterium]|nr:hypothetical protein [Candidatus Saccharimonadales bacterium]